MKAWFFYFKDRSFLSPKCNVFVTPRRSILLSNEKDLFHLKLDNYHMKLVIMSSTTIIPRYFSCKYKRVLSTKESDFLIKALPKYELVRWLWSRSWDWKGIQSDWLSLCPVQGGELVQLAGDLKVPMNIWILSSDGGLKLKHELVPWMWSRSWDWKGFQSDWLSLCPVQGRELVQSAGDLKVPGSYPGWGKFQL